MKRNWRSTRAVPPPQLPLFETARPAIAGAPSGLFFALQPDTEAASRIHSLALRLRDAQQLKGAPVSLDRLHVTLSYLGRYPELPQDLVGIADAAARSVSCAPFELAFDRVMSFPSNQEAPPLVLCRGDDCALLSALNRRLAMAIARTGRFPAAEHGFRPHVTLLYDRKLVAEQAVAPVSWVASEFALIRSLVGRTRYEVLARYPFS